MIRLIGKEKGDERKPHIIQCASSALSKFLFADGRGYLLAVDGDPQPIVPIIHSLARDVTVLRHLLQIRLQPVPAYESHQLGLLSLYGEQRKPVLEPELLILPGLQRVSRQPVGHLESVALPASEHASRTQAQAAHDPEEHPLAES